MPPDNIATLQALEAPLYDTSAEVGRRDIFTTLLTWAIPAALYALCLSYNLAYFYSRGAAVFDAGWFAWLSREGASWPLRNPALIGGNFLSVHFSPVFFLMSSVARTLPNLPYPIWFCLWFSGWLPLLWVSILFLLGQLPWVSTRSRPLAALLIAFNGLALSMLGFPHIESFIPPLILAAIAAIVGARTSRFSSILFGIGFLVFALMLTFREDAGLHACLTFAALALITRRHRVAILFAALAGLGLVYSLTALLAQHAIVPYGGQSLGNIYLGHPAFAGLRPAPIVHRLLYWATARAYIFGPLVMLALVAIWLRDEALAVGVLITLPWLTLSLIAVSPMAGNLWGYYSFPLMIPCLWPLILFSIAPPLDARRVRQLYRLQLAMSALSCLCFVLVGVVPGVGQGGAHDRAPWLHLTPPSIGQIVRTETALHDLETSPDFGRTILDDGVASLSLRNAMPHQYSIDLDPRGLDFTHATHFLRFDNPLPYATASEALLTRIFPACTRITGTALETCARTGR
jgi:hypothetical protein